MAAEQTDHIAALAAAVAAELREAIVAAALAYSRANRAVQESPEFTREQEDAVDEALERLREACDAYTEKT